MNRIGLIFALLTLVWSAIYDWQLTGILLFFFIAVKTDIVWYIEKLLSPIIKNDS